MNPPTPASSSQGASPARAIRIALIVIVFCLSVPNLWLASTLPKYEQIYKDMLVGRALPSATVFVLDARTFLLLLTILIPVAALASFAARPSRSVFIAASLILLILVQSGFTYFAVMSPLAGLLSKLPAP